MYNSTKRRSGEQWPKSRQWRFKKSKKKKNDCKTSPCLSIGPRQLDSRYISQEFRILTYCIILSIRSYQETCSIFRVICQRMLSCMSYFIINWDLYCFANKETGIYCFRNKRMWFRSKQYTKKPWVSRLLPKRYGL